MIGVVIFLIIKNNINKTKILNIDNEKYFLQYDNTWEVSKQEEKEIDLIHKKTESKLNIKMVELEEDDQYKELDQIFDSFLYNIQNQNKDYKLIYKENTTFTKNNINGYKILFEGEGKQFLISLYRQGNTLACFTYEASNNYFDIACNNMCI